jgi:hypothetical protein
MTSTQPQRNSRRATSPRRVAIARGSLAALAVLGVGIGTATQAFADPSQAPNGSVAGATGKNTAAVDGRSTTAALYAAVTGIVPGEGSGFIGQAPPYLAGKLTNGQFVFEPADGSNPGTVSVELMHISNILGGAQASLSCEANEGMESCHVSELADGSQLMTWEEHGKGGLSVRIAEHLVGDLRVTVRATNASRYGLEVSGETPVLSIDQLTTIATQPGWSLDEK